MKMIVIPPQTRTIFIKARMGDLGIIGFNSWHEYTESHKKFKDLVLQYNGKIINDPNDANSINLGIFKYKLNVPAMNLRVVDTGERIKVYFAPKRDYYEDFIYSPFLNTGDDGQICLDVRRDVTPEQVIDQIYNSYFNFELNNSAYYYSGIKIDYAKQITRYDNPEINMGILKFYQKWQDTQEFIPVKNPDIED